MPEIETPQPVTNPATQRKLDDLAVTAAELKNRESEITVEKLLAELRKAQFDNMKAEVAAVTPDLSKVVSYETSTTGQLLGPTLSLQAVSEAATSLVESFRPLIAQQRVLVIGNGMDAYRAMGEQHESVSRLVAMLETRASTLLEATNPQPVSGVADTENLRGFHLVGTAALASPGLALAASLLPAALSLVNVKHTLESTTFTIDANAAVTAVVRELLDDQVQVVLPGLPVKSSGPLHDRLVSLETTTRQMLLLRLMYLDQQLANTEETSVVGKAISSQRALVADAMSGIDALSLLGTPNAQGVSLRQSAIHADVAFAHPDLKVLVLTSLSGSSDQLLSDRPLWSTDHLGVVTHASLSFLLLEHGTGTIVSARMATGCVSADASLSSRGISVKLRRWQFGHED
jgi:hypothetical protein